MNLFHKEEPSDLDIALQAADAGNAGDWPTVAGILADEYRKVKQDLEMLRKAKVGASYWQPISSAPRDNKRMLYLARIHDGEVIEIDFDAIWESDRESWEMPEVYYYWASANGNVEEPTHWAYQDEGPPPTAIQPTE